ncbi:hypothetical protein P3W85_10920 [Cupriavidus basilensis]|uniref:Lipoprotein n=1 Tax=Cupriavidus basilensis TaxID=68895 RepID=A0ABT6ANZ4_9BURK|nr:hypothetical protein [Cupriavidus basilensis]MDF3833456.1 hypothetical protein [Cupriavidus basilensis]
MKALLLHLLLSVALTACGLAAYDYLAVRPLRVVGVVDVAEVYRLKEAEFTQLLTQGNSEEDKQRALAMARTFSQRLPAALEELPRECNCLVVLRTSLAGPTPRTLDLTPALRRKVNAP